MDSRMLLEKKVPIQSISVDVVIQDFIANVVIELQYKNKDTVSLEVVVDVRLDKDVAVYAFEGIMDGKRAEAQIMEKEQVKQKVEEIWGKDAALFKWDPNDRDIFGCMLGSLPPDGEATLKLHYVQALAPAPGGATHFVLPVVPNPHYVPQASEDDSAMQSIPEVLEEQLSCLFSLSTTLDFHYGISHVESNYTLAGLQYTTEDHTTAQISLAEGHHFDQDVELLIYYEEDFHKPVALVEPGKPGVDPGSLMREPVLLLNLYPKVSAPKPGLNATGEFLFLVDCSNNMSYSTGRNPDSQSRIQSAKVLPDWTQRDHNGNSFGQERMTCGKSVKYTQWTMLDSLRRVMSLKANLGEAEILQPLKAIYSQPCYEGYARQLFIFTHRETSDMDEVIAEVQTHSCSHRCFTFGIGEWSAFHTLNGMAEAGHGSAEFIHETEKMQAKALQSMKKSIDPVMMDISLCWDLPPGLEAKLVQPIPQIIYTGECSLICVQICGQQQASNIPM
ncbi:von Willebrand factor A domain-containing protein 5A-like [Sceloporus undulatus]|uniref:von Willebrand factor A domain-containing protein 5A-like n=1 Tax=Sceloporus undulatus TaxID=8520 RepID=UPI001C4DD823|nr:von Willebrand factor A domain-containing protein 5A-like [Sceloporus undulatus]XP_042328175.1 von Willebrand factor A domain-containing protein 5A-like [Sceloporus undulatus]XP_042328176.1 von Willebrand factor A domain-containing protein 5A-like [Sceloporus undulatus]XP_042328177.1 von Willebrand factor A domain-containing protein 5A-like [Sceloporus undulatus]